MASPKIELPTPEQARATMLKNTVVMETLAQQIKGNIGELISLIDEFQQGVASDGKQ